jgi:phage-related protein
MARTVLLNLLGTDNASRAFRSASREADRTADSVDRLNDRNAAAGDSGGRLTSMLGRLAPAAGQAAASIGTVAAGLGASIPVAAGLVATLVQIAPAAAVAATGIGAAALAMGAFKIGMQGVSEAATAALDPSNPEAYAAALAKLSPNARAFVQEIRALQPALAGIKTAVQDRLFENLGASLKTTAAAVLPDLKRGLVEAAGALNGMAFNAMGAARSLAKNGTLGAAVDGATGGLKNLTKVPGQVLTAFVQLAAAAAPAFGRLTKAIGNVATKASQALSGAFKSGAIGDAIDVAVGLLKELGAVAKNVFTIVSNIFKTAQVSGGGFVGTLKTITGALAKVSANPAFQAGLRAIFQTMNQLATTAAPLLAQALLAIAPVFTALGPPLQLFIQQLGVALQPVIAALGPALVAMATSFGTILTAVAPLLPVLGQLVAGILTPLAPILAALTPAIVGIVGALRVWSAVQGVLNVLLAANPIGLIVIAIGALVAGLIYAYKNSETFRDVVNGVWEAVKTAFTTAWDVIRPALVGLKDAFVHLGESLQPLVDAIGNLISEGIQAIQPYLPTLGDALKTLAGIFTDTLKLAIDGITLAVELTAKAIDTFTQFLNGDASASLKNFGQTAQETATSIVESLGSLPEKTGPALGQWAIKFGLALNDIADEVKDVFGALYDDIEVVMIKIGARIPGALRAAVGGVKAAATAVGKAVLAGLNIVAPELVWAVRNWVKGMTGILSAVVPRMIAIGKSIIGGLVSGIKSAIPSLSGALGAITSMIPDWKGPPEKDAKLLRPAGVAIMGGLIEGIDSQTVKLKGKLGEVTQTITKAFGEGTISLVPIGDLGKKLRQALTKGADEISDVVKQIRAKINDAFKAGTINAGQRDGLVDYLTTTNKKLRTLAKERAEVVDKIKEITDYAKKITESVLNYAAITNIKGDDGAAPNGGQLVAGLQARLATIREFGANIKKLAGAGLSKALLRQILDAGIDGGAAIAAELANGPSSIIAALNTAQTQITKIAKGIGLDGADALFGSGKAMGDAFLKGLKSLEKALVDSMELLVEKLLKALTGGVDKAKGKLTELADASYKINELAVAVSQVKLVPYNPGPNPKAPTPLVNPPAPKAVPKYVAPPVKNNVLTSNNKGVTVNMGGVTLRDKADTDMLMNAVQTKIRAAAF